MKLNKNSFPTKLLERINNGEEKTYDQWAKATGRNISSIKQVVYNLRRNGHMIYPIGSIHGFGDEAQPGILRNVLDSKKYVSEIMHRSSKQEIPPRIKSIVKLMEEAILEYPDQWPEIETYISQIMLMGVNSKEELKELKAHPERHEEKN